ALLALKQEGLVRAVGVGVRSHDFHRRCILSGDFDVSLTFCDYNLLDQSAADDLLDLAAAHDVGLVNAAAVMLGLLGGGDPRLARSHLATEDRVRRAYELWQWAASKGVSLSALNLQLCLRELRLASTLVGAADPEELHADLQALQEPVQAAVWAELGERFGVRGV
ncbi:MAG: aldo/keto reductase, partial [Armatimonadetes bacterium]|nr:aldo/keto reductase [Armatimonadota bacterium]